MIALGWTEQRQWWQTGRSKGREDDSMAEGSRVARATKWPSPSDNNNRWSGSERSQMEKARAGRRRVALIDGGGRLVIRRQRDPNKDVVAG